MPKRLEKCKTQKDYISASRCFVLSSLNDVTSELCENHRKLHNK